MARVARLIRSSLNALSFAVVRLEFMCGSVSLGNATGFFDRIDGRRYLITNWHCVTGRHPNTGRAEADDGITPDAVLMHMHSVAPHVGDSFVHKLPAAGIRVPIEYGTGSTWKMHRSGQKVDVALTEIGPILPAAGDVSGTIDCCLSNLNVTRDVVLNVGNDVVVIGFPSGLTPTLTLPIWKGGSVATEPSIPAQNEPCFWIDAATRKGMSGSPVFRRSYSQTSYASTRRQHVTIDMPVALDFVGVYSGRMGVADKLEAQLGKVWWPDNVYDIVRDGVSLGYTEKL